MEFIQFNSDGAFLCVQSGDGGGESGNDLAKFHTGNALLRLLGQVRNVDKSNLGICTVIMMQQRIQQVVAHESACAVRGAALYTQRAHSQNNVIYR